MHGEKLDVKKIEDGRIYIGYTDSRHPSTSMPVESWKHFQNDLAGKVDVPKSNDPVIEAVRTGKAEFLGKGNEGLAFRIGDEVAKVSTTVPLIPTNPGHRTPGEAMARLRDEAANAEEARKAGVPGLLKSRFVEHGDKGFLIRPAVDIPDKLTGEMLDDVKAKLEGMHKAGYALNDDVQVGVREGKVYFFDTGTMAKLPKNERHRREVIDHDMSRLSYLFRKNGRELKHDDESDLELTRNAFCPTGKGGGIDPTCAPGAGQWAKEAREAGISPSEVFQEAHMMFAAEEEYRQTVSQMLKEASEAFVQEGGGKRLTRNHPAFRDGDPSQIKGFDKVARIMAGRYPEILGAHGYEDDSKDTAEAALFDLLAAGTPKPRSRAHYYGQAIDTLLRRKRDTSEVPF